MMSNVLMPRETAEWRPIYLHDIFPSFPCPFRCATWLPFLFIFFLQIEYGMLRTNNFKNIVHI